MKTSGLVVLIVSVLLVITLVGGSIYFLAESSSYESGANSSVQESSENIGINAEKYQVNQQYEIVVYKSPTCGCCEAWVEAMEQAGYRMQVHTSDEQLRKMKQALNVPLDKQSCHTGTVEGYVLEGHVHPDSIARLLKEKAKIRGLYLPGMVAGSVGMEQGDIRERYAIIALDYDNKVSIYDIYN